jgi:hypothetical protein
MRIVPALCSSVIVCGLLAIRMATAADSPPAWAYTPNNPDYKPPVDDGKPVRVPDSTAGYTWSQLRDRFIAPVWHPGDHGALPEIVANGRKPGTPAVMVRIRRGFPLRLRKASWTMTSASGC